MLLLSSFFKPFFLLNDILYYSFKIHFCVRGYVRLNCELTLLRMMSFNMPTELATCTIVIFASKVAITPSYIRNFLSHFIIHSYI